MVAAAKEYVMSRNSMFGSRMSREASRQPTRAPRAAASAQAPLRTRPLRMPTSCAWSGLEAFFCSESVGLAWIGHNVDRWGVGVARWWVFMVLLVVVGAR